jgi:tRNA (guanine37-N1)-methyltransferase
MQNINIITLFPEFFEKTLDTSILRIAREKQKVKFNLINLRSYGLGPRKTTDRKAFGGGAGMVVMIEPIFNVLKDLEKQKVKGEVILTSAKGKMWTQEKARSFSQKQNLTFICGHYEGVDERVAQNLVDHELRIGNFVLTGGEVASLVMIDSSVRLIEGVLHNQDSLKKESHSQENFFTGPVYTRPRAFNGWSVPEICFSGDHQKIKKLRKK